MIIFQLHLQNMQLFQEINHIYKIFNIMTIKSDIYVVRVCVAFS